MFNRVSHKFNKVKRAHQRQRHYAAAFDARAKARLLLVTIPEKIPGSQVFPFHFYRDALRKRYDADVSELTLEDFLSGERQVAGANIVAFQTKYEFDEALRDQILARVAETAPGARLVYLDWYAPTDLRFAELIGPYVDVYFKKHVLKDRRRYGLTTLGDTTLMDFYGRQTGLDLDEVRFNIPPYLVDKMVIGPSFMTADFILPGLSKSELPSGPRPIDLHARVSTDGDPWYAAMRSGAKAAVDKLQGHNVLSGTGIRHDQFLGELRQSKTCYSTFGYGEVCWRDFEAIQAGAVLIKEDMSHVETDPDVFIAEETYVPIRWDRSNLQEIVDALIADPARRERIARNAHKVLTDWAKREGFVDQVAPIFEGIKAKG